MEQVEIWKDVVGWEGLYQVSNLGNVRSYPKLNKTGKPNKMKGKVLKTTMGFSYLYVQLCRQNVKVVSNHILVAKAFCENPNSKPFVNHINGVKIDNRAVNLEWVTAKENSQHAIEIGLTPIGENKKSAKLKNDEVREIRKDYDRKVGSVLKLAKKYGVKKDVIKDVLRGKTYRRIV